MKTFLSIILLNFVLSAVYVFTYVTDRCIKYDIMLQLGCTICLQRMKTYCNVASAKLKISDMRQWKWRIVNNAHKNANTTCHFSSEDITRLHDNSNTTNNFKSTPCKPHAQSITMLKVNAKRCQTIMQPTRRGRWVNM